MLTPMFSLNFVREAWKRFADEFGAQHIGAGEPSGLNMLDKIVYQHQGVAITLDSTCTGRTAATRIYAPVAVAENFNFGISPEHFLTKFEKFFGRQDVEIGDPVFDEKLIVQTENPEKLKSFLSSQKIRELLLAVSARHSLLGVSWRVGETELEARGNGGWRFDDLPRTGNYLVIRQNGIIDNVEHLKLSFQLAIESLEHLRNL
jgi:hypothetical protein